MLPAPGYRPVLYSGNPILFKSRQVNQVGGPLEWHGGPVQKSPVVYLIYWGSDWLNSENSSAFVAVNTFYNALISADTAWHSTMTQYWDTTGHIASRPTIGGTYIDRGLSAPSGVSGSAIEAEIQHAMSVNSWSNSANAQFIVLTPKATSYAATFDERRDYCAYHSYLGGGIVYQFVPFPANVFSNCGEPAQMSESTAHEYAEATTDPKINAWLRAWLTYNASGEAEGLFSEIGDLCLQSTEWASGIKVEKLWDDHLNACTAGDQNPPQAPAPSPPEARTTAVTSVTATAATVTGTAISRNDSIYSFFEYGETTGYGHRFPSSGYIENPWDMNYPTALEYATTQTIEGLTPERTYHYRLVTTDGLRTAYGADLTFNTAGLPVLTMGGTMPFGPHSNLVLGSVNPNGSDTQFQIEWGLTTSYGNLSPSSPEEVGSFHTTGTVMALLEGLQAETTYHARIVAYSSGGRYYSADMAFRTGTWRPVVFREEIAEAIEIPHEQLLYAELGPEGSDTNYYFQWGTTTSYGNVQPATPADVGDSLWGTNAYQWISGLRDGATYHFRVVAENPEGRTYGADVPFTAPDWRPATSIDSASSVTSSSAVLSGSVTPHALDTHYQFEYGTTTSYGSHVPASKVDIGSEPYVTIPVTQTAVSLAPATTYHFRLMAENEDGVTYSADRTFTTQPVISPPSYSLSVGSLGSGVGQVSTPADLAVDVSGNVWVADKGNNRVEEFNARGEYVSQFGSVGSGNGQLSAPLAVAVDGSGNVWVADSGNHRLEKFNSRGEYLLKCGSLGSGNGQFSSWGPRDVAVDAGGSVWATDYSARVQKFSSACEFVKSVGTSGTGDGQFRQTGGVDVAGGKVWVADWESNRVSVLNESGEFLFKFGSAGSGNGQFSHSDGIDVDSKGDVWVVDEGHNRVEEFNGAGEYVTAFGSSGSGAGQFSLYWPSGIASDNNGNLWVTDIRNNRIEKWTYAP